MKRLLLLILLFGCTQAEVPDLMPEEPIVKEEVVEKEIDTEPPEQKTISLTELAKHNTEDDCWVMYDGSVFDLTGAPRHASMDKTFWRHCGQETGFEEGARGKHSGSNRARVMNYATFVGDLES